MAIVLLTSHACLIPVFRHAWKREAHRSLLAEEPLAVADKWGGDSQLSLDAPTCMSILAAVTGPRGIKDRDGDWP